MWMHNTRWKHWPELLPQADIVALSLPGYSDTKGVIGEKELHLMKENTILLNVGRGTAIDSLGSCESPARGSDLWGRS